MNYDTYPPRCNERLHAEKKPLPRTCAVCGFGPCHAESRPVELDPIDETIQNMRTTSLADFRRKLVQLKKKDLRLFNQLAAFFRFK